MKLQISTKSGLQNRSGAKKGILADADENNKSKWLLEDVGLVTFGIEAAYDRSGWIKRYSESTGAQIFHILGPDWAFSGQNYYNHIPGGYKDWFPAMFNKKNISTIRELGDKFAPFELDYIINIKGADSNLSQKALLVFPKPLRTKGAKDFNFLCPVAEFTKDLHIRRDERLAADYDIDAMYYDISANNTLHACMDPNHGHTVGAGSEITRAYRNTFLDTKTAMNKASNKYIPQGTETITEAFIDVLDFYQARAETGHACVYEGSNFRQLIHSYAAEKIPMFTYVYHEYGPVRMDGWGRLAEEAGTLFYKTVAQVYLWGGLYELNYEYSPMEMLDGRENPINEHYAIIESRKYEFVPERASYVGQFADLRTGEGNKYLAYGTLLRPLEFECGKIELDWYIYNVPTKWPQYYNSRGKEIVDCIVHSAWKYKDESIGLFFANVSDSEQKVNTVIELGKYELKGNKFSIRVVMDGKSEDLGQVTKKEPKELELTLPPRTVVMVEIR